MQRRGRQAAAEPTEVSLIPPFILPPPRMKAVWMWWVPKAVMASCPYACVVCSPRAHPTHAHKDKVGSPGCPNEGRTWKQTTGSFQKELNGPTAARGLTMLASEPSVSGCLHPISIV